MSGPNRLHHGRAHEIAVREKLREHGWTVQDWGQGILSDEIRVALRADSREPAVLWRWIPDLIAVKGSRVVLVDPKTDLRGDTANFTIEISAWQAHLAMLPLGLHVVYVWADFTCNTAQGIQPASDPKPGVAEHRTWFYLIRKDQQRPFEWAFGDKPIRQAG
jgi:hypothetical protein